MSNQRKAAFVNGDFHMQCFWASHGKISPKSSFMLEGQVSPDFPEFSNPAIF
jgi:hypothetical protein